MSQPHKCPVCEGSGEQRGWSIDHCPPKCPACDGKGVVWEPETDRGTMSAGYTSPEIGYVSPVMT